MKIRKRILIFGRTLNFINLDNSYLWVVMELSIHLLLNLKRLYMIQLISRVNSIFWRFVWWSIKQKLHIMKSFTSYFLNYQKMKIKKYNSMFRNNVIKSIKNITCNIKLTGCFFSFSLIMWRKIQSDSQTIKYKNENKC